jgi:type IV secretion system protein VirD4
VAAAAAPGAGKKKPDALSMALYAALAAAALYTAAGLGAALDMSVGSNGKVNIALLADNAGATLSKPGVVAAALGNGGYAPKLLFVTAAAVGLYALYKAASEKKRLHRKGVEHGSAKWGDAKEMASLADRGKSTKEPRFILAATADGQRIFDEEGDFAGFWVDNNVILSREVLMSVNTRQHRKNLNVLIIGGSGSGKTRHYAKPNLMQLNTSYVVTDPKGEILQATGTMLTQAGYELKVLNLIEMAHSNNYNPFEYVYDYDGNLAEASVTKLLDVFMKNTRGEGEKDDFWSQSAVKLLTAVTLLLFEESEYNAERDGNGRIKPETRDKTRLNFFSATEKMRRLVFPLQGNADGFFLDRLADETDEQYRVRREEAHLCPLDKDFLELERRKGPYTLAMRLYREIRNNPQETGQSILSAAGARTQFFNLGAVADLTCCDNIRLETLGDKKTALFIIIPATDSTFNFLAAMMYTQMFDVLANRANFKYGGTLPVHVRCIMDEFANIGQIPDFEKVIAFVRSMGMSLSVIIQSLAQLKARYEKTWEVITGNCDTHLFLGGKEESTTKSVSETLGKETIDVESRNRTKTGGHKGDSTAESNSILGRELMTPDELQKLDEGKCVLMIRAHNPFYCDKYPIEEHVNYRHLEDYDEGNTFDKASVKVVTLEERCLNPAAAPEAAMIPDGAKETMERIFPREGDEVSAEAIAPGGYIEAEASALAAPDEDVEEVYFGPPTEEYVEIAEMYDFTEPSYDEDTDTEEREETGESEDTCWYDDAPTEEYRVFDSPADMFAASASPRQSVHAGVLAYGFYGADEYAAYPTAS